MTMNTFQNETYSEVIMKCGAYNESHKKDKDFNFTMSVYFLLLTKLVGHLIYCKY